MLLCRPSWGLAGVVAVIVTGLLLLVQGEAEFDATGFVLVMSASCMSGLRFTLTQLLLHGKKGDDEHDQAPMPFGGPLEVLEVLTPVMSITTLLLSLATEQLWNTLPGSPYFSSLEHILFTLLVIFVGAVIAFLMVWTEYQVIKETSALTFMIAGTVKEVVTVITAVAVFGDQFGLINGIGLFVVILGVLLFNWYKLQRLKQVVGQRMSSKDGSNNGGSILENGSAHARAKSPGSQTAAPASNGLHSHASLSKKRSGGEDEEEAELVKALEFEPLLPISGVIRR
eukprot:GHRR01012726.1.p1 GENE.GHRR01012726.1~~GHRR01012726.1.p1  ORF type:complete len:284 (+),score=81.44 GHRR01012726.1:382-1233(+)